MELVNWKKTSEFLSLVASLRNQGDEVGIEIGRMVQVGWYHIQLLLTLFPDKRIAFITKDDRVRHLIQLAGCKVYSHPSENKRMLPTSVLIAQENLSGLEYIHFHVTKFFHKIFSTLSRKFFPKRVTVLSIRHTSWYMIVLGIVVLLLFMIGIVSLTTPHASLIITPQTSVQSAVKNVMFVTEDAITDPAQIPMRKDIFPVEKTLSFRVNAFDNASLMRARGTVKITNTNADTITFKPQTRISIDKLVFRLEKATTLPGAVDGQPSEVYAQVVSDPVGTDGILMGKRGNISKDTQLVFPGLSSEDHTGISIVSNDDFVGGDDVAKHVLTQQEYDRITKTVNEQVNEDAKNYITSHYNLNAEFVPVPLAEALTILDTSLEFSQNVGAYVDTVDVHVRSNFLIYLYHVQILKKTLLETAYSHLLEGTESLLEVSDGPPDIIATLSTTKDPFTVKATAQLPVRVLYDFESEAGTKTLQNILSDLLEADVDRVEKTLLNHPYIKAVDVRLTPFWSSKLPSTLDRIYIKVQKQDN